MDWDKRISIARAAAYKSENLSNAEIARLLRVDVSSVSRYLSQAEKAGWLRLSLSLPEDLKHAVTDCVRHHELESHLLEEIRGSDVEGASRARLRPEGVIVVRENEQRDQQYDDEGIRMGALAAQGAALLRDILMEQRAEATTLGVAWGRTTHAVIGGLGAFSDRRPFNVRVVPLQGGMGYASGEPVNAPYYPDVLAQSLSEVLNTPIPPLRLCLPAYIDHHTASQVGDEGLEVILDFIRRERSFRAVSDAYSSLDVALIGVGGLESGGWAFTSGYLSSGEEGQSLKKVGVCGDIVCRFYRGVPEDPIETKEDLARGDVQDKGRTLLYRTNRRAVGISLAQIRERVAAGARIIAVAGGSQGKKALAIFGAAVNGYVTDLVTDEATARQVLKHCHDKVRS